MHEQLSMHILDIAVNSISAGARRIKICLSDDLTEDRLRIIIADNGSGMDANLIRRVTDSLYSSKTDRLKRIGLGISMLSQVAENCGGRLKLHSRSGVGTVVLAEFKRSHLDLPAIGDLSGAMLCLMMAGPEVDVSFSRVRKTENGVVSRYLDTRSIKKELGDPNLIQSPPVIAFIRRELEAIEEDFKSMEQNPRASRDGEREKNEP